MTLLLSEAELMVMILLLNITGGFLLREKKCQYTLANPKLRHLYLKKKQLTLKLSWAYTVPKVQGLSSKAAVISFDLEKQESFAQWHMYMASSRVNNINNLYFIRKYNVNAIQVNQDTTTEYKRHQKQSKVKTVIP